MTILEAHQIARTIETQKGINEFIDMVLRNENYTVMDDINVNLGKMVDDIAEKYGIPFSFNTFYTKRITFEEK